MVLHQKINKSEVGKGTQATSSQYSQHLLKVIEGSDFHIFTKDGESNNNIDNLYLLPHRYRDTEYVSSGYDQWRLFATGKLWLAGQTQRKEKQ